MDCFQGEQVENTDQLGGGPRKDELSYLRENTLDRVAYRAHQMITIKDKQLDEAASSWRTCAGATRAARSTTPKCCGSCYGNGGPSGWFSPAAGRKRPRFQARGSGAIR